MANTLKDALMKAGLRATQHENERKKPVKWEQPQKSVAHQERRNYCEVCDNVQPDVERYAHKNPLIDAQWICVACADKNMIEDRFRATHQSDFAIRGLFRREYGPTRKGHEFDRAAVKPGDNKNDRQPDRGGRHDHRNDQRHDPRAERGNSRERPDRNDKNKGEAHGNKAKGPGNRRP